MEFKKYMHIERLGREEVEGILNGTCYIFPKIDGTNSVVFIGEDGKIHAGSRRQELDHEKGLDNQGFMANIINDKNIAQYLVDHPYHYIYGEWLVKHSIGYYNADAWRKFYIFDVFDASTGCYLNYDVYKNELERYGIKNIIPLMARLENPSQDDITALLQKNHYLINEDEPRFGEGVVIKNYNFVNKYGSTTFAKVVASEFLKNKQLHREKNHMVKLADALEEKIVQKFLSEEVIEKEYQKLINEGVNYTENRNKFIGILFNRIWHEFLNEEITAFDKKFHHPTINFALLRKAMEFKVKETKPNLF